MIRAYKFGCLPPEDWSQVCEQEISWQTAYWNQLVRIETSYQENKAKLYASFDPQLAADQTHETELRALEGSLWNERKAIRKGARKGVETPELDTRINFTKNELKEVWARLKVHRAAVLRAHPEAFRAINQTRHEQLTAARKATPLWWGNYNAVDASFDAAIRRLGPGESLNPREGLQGKGRLTNQLQKDTKNRRWADLFKEGHSQVRLDPDPDHTKGRGKNQGKWYRLTLTACTNPSLKRTAPDYRTEVSLPVCLHRAIPDDAVITFVTLTRERRFLWQHINDDPRPTQWKWHVVFTADEPDTNPLGSNLAAGIDIGWRLMDDHIRVATVYGSDGSEHFVKLPLAWIDDRKRQSERLGALRSDFNDQAERYPVFVDPKHPRVGELVKASREAGDAELDEWRRDDRRERMSTNDRITRLNRQRQYNYRLEAKAIAEKFGTVVIDAEGIKKMAEQRVPRPIALQRTWSAVAELAAEISRAVKAAGGQIRKATGRSTQTCHCCGHINKVAEMRRTDLIWRCQGCGALWDQDINAAINLCRFAEGKASGLAARVADTNKTKRARRNRKANKDTTRTIPLNPLSDAAE